MKWIKNIKKKKNRDNKKKSQKYNNSQNSDPQSLRKDKESNEVKKTQISYNFENFRKLKVYKRPIIDDFDEREQLHNQILKELEKLD
jgi:hypothetical protein